MFKYLKLVDQLEKVSILSNSEPDRMKSNHNWFVLLTHLCGVILQMSQEDDETETDDEETGIWSWIEDKMFYILHRNVKCNFLHWNFKDKFEIKNVCHLIFLKNLLQDALSLCSVTISLSLYAMSISLSLFDRCLSTLQCEKTFTRSTWKLPFLLNTRISLLEVIGKTFSQLQKGALW